MSDGNDRQSARSVHIRIEGNVQGVGFRNWMQRMAGQLGLTGWARNRRDGSVEAVLTGPTAAVEEALQRCKMGPRSAKVTTVRVLGDGAPVVTGFEILPGF